MSPEMNRINKQKTARRVALLCSLLLSANSAIDAGLVATATEKRARTIAEKWQQDFLQQLAYAKASEKNGEQLQAEKQLKSLVDRTRSASVPAKFAIDAQNAIAGFYKRNKRYSEAKQFYASALATAREFLPAQQITADVLFNYADLCESQKDFGTATKFYEEMLSIERQGASRQLVEDLCTVSDFFVRQGNREKAAATLQTGTALPGLSDAEYLILAKRLTNIGDSYHKDTDYPKCEAIRKQVVEIYRKHSKSKQELANFLNGLVAVELEQTKSFEVEAIAQECYQLYKEVLGPEAPDTLRALKHLGIAYGYAGRDEEAEKIEFEVLHLREKVLEPNNPSLATSLSNCAIRLSARKKFDEALQLLKRARAIRVANGGEDDEHTVSCDSSIGSVLREKFESMPRSTPEEKKQAYTVLSEAEAVLTKALQINLKMGRDKARSTIAIQKTLSYIYYHNVEDSKSEELLKQSQNTQQKTLGTGHSAVRRRLYLQAEKFWKNTVWQRIAARHRDWIGAATDSPYTDALTQESKGDLQGALKTTRAVLGRPEIQELALLQLHGNLLEGDILCRQSQYAEAQKAYDKALAIAETAQLPEAELWKAVEASTLNKQLSGNDENLIPSFERIAKLRQAGESAAGGLTSLDRAIRFKKLSGITYSDASNSLSVWKNIVQSQPQSQEVADYAFDTCMALSYVLCKDPNSKTDEYKDALNTAILIANTTRAAPLHAERLLSICDFLLEDADYGKAQAAQQEAMTLSEQAADKSLQCKTALTGARISLTQGDYQPALAQSENALALSKETNEEQRVQALELLCESASRAGSASNNSTLIAKALESAEAALKIQDQRQSSAAQRAQVLTAIARLHLYQSRLAESRQAISRAIALCEQATDAEAKLAFADALSELAVLEFLKKDYAAARDAISRAMEIHDQDRSQFAIAEQVRDLDMLALIDHARGYDADARSEALQASSRLDGYVNDVLPELSLAEQRAFLDTISDTSMILASICSDKDTLPSAYKYLMRWKGLLVEGLRRQSQLGDAAKDSRYADIVSQLQKLRAEIALVTGTTAEDRARLSELTARKEGLERQLPGIKDPSQGVGLNEFQNLLGAQEALIDILSYRDLSDDSARYAAIITGKTGAPKFVDLGEIAAINRMIADWRDSGIYSFRTRDVTIMEEDGRPAVGASEQASDNWSSLVSKIWSPLKKALPATATRLWICEDGELSRVPWSKFVLESPDSQQMLLCHVDSPRELISLKKVPAKNVDNLPILIAGAVTYKNPRLQLAGAAKEVEEIARLAALNAIKTTVLTQQQPTRGAVIAKLSSSKDVHLATHGFFKSAELGAKNRSLGTRSVAFAGTADTCFVAGRNPLVRSGLLLASSPGEQGSEESRLTAEELVGIDLRNCDLLTLSACDTGRGEEITGQGVMGLRSAIMAGGARSVLLSLWPVDDEATRALMRQFYTNLWSKKMSKAEALKQAQLAVRNDPTHPSWKRPVYWSGWELVGEGWK